MQENLVSPTITTETHWAAHVPFSRWLISELKPNIFVELGTENGHSFFNIADSIQNINRQSKCFAIDTWIGDEFTSEYSEEVYNSVVKINQDLFQNNLSLLRMRFDSALNLFKPRTIDLLHIDGSHKYEDVKNDFEKWLPKVSQDGVILIHDIQVRDSHFGVYDFWQEISQSYKHIEFFHGFGLGVIFLNESVFKKLVQNYGINTKDFIANFEVLGAKYLKNLERINLNKIESLEIENKSLKKYNQNLSRELSSMKNSKIWKVSYPYRKLKDKIVWNFRYLSHNPLLKGYSSGIKKSSFELKNCKTPNAKIAVIFHAYYLDEILEVIRNIATISVPFDLYISSSQAIDEAIFADLHQIQQIRIDQFENRGRDILPFIHLFQKYNFYNYQYVLKVHTKKSDWLNSNYEKPIRYSTGEIWKKNLLKDLLGSEKNFLEVIKIFESQQNVGLVTSLDSIVPLKKNLGGNKLFLWEVMRKIGIRRIPSFVKFPAGSMYWFRPEIFSQEVVNQLSSLAFQDELGQNDATLAHGFERLVGILVRRSNYTMTGHKFEFNHD